MGEVDKAAPAPEAKGSEDVEAEITVRVTKNGKVQSVAAWERRAVMPVQAQGVRYAQYVPKTAYLALRAELASAREEIAKLRTEMSKLPQSETVAARYPTNSMCASGHQMVLWMDDDFGPCPVCAILARAKEGEER